MRALLVGGLGGLMCLGSAIGQGAAAKASPDALSASGKQWHELLEKGGAQRARVLCSGWEKDGTLEQKVEAEKCLTDLVLRGAPAWTAREAQSGKPRYPEALADEALAHIAKGLELKPDDATLNVGRLFALADMRRYEAMKTAFAETLEKMPEEDAASFWQQTLGDMVADGHTRGALVIAEELYAREPQSHEAAGNVGALHDALKEWEQGLPFLRKAVELAPGDAIDTWNLGLALDHLGQEDEADKWMAASLKLPSEDESLKGRRCLYGRFLVMKRKEPVQGCVLVRSACGSAARLPVCAMAKKAR